MNIIESLLYIFVGIFFMDGPNWRDLRRQTPTKSSLKGACKIDFFGNRHTLTCFDSLEDFVDIINSAYYTKTKNVLSYQIRPLIYNSPFRMDEKTIHAMA